MANIMKPLNVRCFTVQNPVPKSGVENRSKPTSKFLESIDCALCAVRCALCAVLSVVRI